MADGGGAPAGAGGTAVAVRIHGKRVLAHLKETRTDWPDMKAWYTQRKGIDSFAPHEVAERAGVEIAAYSMRAVPGSDRAARELAASFAWGPDGRLAEAFRGATKGDTILDGKIAVLMSWLDGEAGDDDAAAARFELGTAKMKAKGGSEDVLEALLCAFAPNAWGGCALAHLAAVSANEKFFGKATVANGLTAADAKRAAGEFANEYHVAMFADLVG